MNSLSNELKSVISQRLQVAGPREILSIASALCADEAVQGAATRVVEDRRFTTYNGEVTADHSTGLMWSRENVPGGKMKWKAASDACAKLNLGGYTDWRLPTVRELLTLVDYERHEPAIDTEAFKCDSSYYWTSTVVNSSPSVCAWCVPFANGHSNWSGQGGEFSVRAVRASQSLDLWHVR